jgi:hypothetical protein
MRTDDNPKAAVKVAAVKERSCKKVFIRITGKVKTLVVDA